MNPLVREIIRVVAVEHRVDPGKVAGSCRTQRVVLARAEAARRLEATGYYTDEDIARFLRKDRTTVLYYLGRLGSMPSKLHWKPPTVRHLVWLHRPSLPPPPKVTVRYLLPYAGADVDRYVWKERPDDRRRQVSQDRRHAETTRTEIRGRAGPTETGT